MTANEDARLAVVEAAWHSTLGLPLDHTGFNPEMQPEVSAFVQVTGDWRGLVMLCCTERLARRVTGAMFELPPDDTESEMVRDAIGEMANILGGQIKTGIAGSTSLSLPTVVQGDGHSIFVPHLKTLETRTYTCEGEPMWVRLYEHVEIAAGEHIERRHAA